MIKNKKENQGFDHQESFDDVKKMSQKPFSSNSELLEGKSKTKINGAPASSALGSGNSSVRVCDFCGRQFSSGKALGGHRRYHIQEQRKLQAQNQAQNEKVNNGHQYPSNNHHTLRIKPKDFVIGGDNDDNDNNLMKSNIGNPNSSSSLRSFSCCVCDKDFPTEKSLYGHMRSHPEREWRGTNPPFTTTCNKALASPSSSSSSSTEELMKVAVEDHQCHDKKINNAPSSTLEESSLPVLVDLSSSCSGTGWFKKDRRGRKSIGAVEAAQTLMYIYYLHRPLTRPEPPEEAAVILPVKKRKKNVKNHIAAADGGSSSSSPAGKQSLEDSDDDGDASAADNDDDERKDELKAADENNIWEMKVISLMKEQKLKKKKKKKKKMKLGPDIINSEGELLIRTLKQEVVKPSSSQSYVCDICGQAFSIFQALGGHKSKHNRGKNIVISTKGKEVIGQRAEGGGGGGGKVCINNGASLSSAGLLSCEEEGASLMTSEERLVICSNNDNYENNSNNEEEMGGASNASAGSKMRDFDLNVPYVVEHEATDVI